MTATMKKIKNTMKALSGKTRQYSWTYNKMGTFFFLDGQWWFYPDDNSFVRGKANAIVEWGHGNPLFDWADSFIKNSKKCLTFTRARAIIKTQKEKEI